MISFILSYRPRNEQIAKLTQIKPGAIDVAQHYPQ